MMNPVKAAIYWMIRKEARTSAKAATLAGTWEGIGDALEEMGGTIPEPPKAIATILNVPKGLEGPQEATPTKKRPGRPRKTATA